MSPERWQQVKQLFDAASRLGPAERARFLAEACGGDAELRREVEALVAAHEAAGSFMESPAVGEVAAMLDDERRGLQVGQSVGHYRVVAPLGAGGMGEIYLAEDTMLGRKVAIKLLPPAASADESSNRRLLREARAAATLDHPHICSVYEVGEDAGRTFVVMQYVEGETLDARLRRQPPSLEESITLAAQIADALAEAHAQGIVHRDIKPSNVLLNRRGQAKVADFGLAKLTRQAAPFGSGARTQSLLTTPGMVVGTVPYMSPEQVRGEEVDARTDVFSLGVILYEMLSGRQPFFAESAAGTMSAILTREPPPLARYTREANAELERIVGKALRKDREDRYQTARDLLLDLRSLADEMRFEARLERSTPPDAKDDQSAEASGAQTVIIETAPHAAARTTAGDEQPTREGKKGLSAGAQIGLVLAAVEGRYRSVFLGGFGLWNPDLQTIAEASPINFAPHIRPPKLMAHGRYDEDTPLKTQAEPLFKLLREPKRMVLYDGPHVPPPEFLVPVMNVWLDETLGPVRRE